MTNIDFVSASFLLASVLAHCCPYRSHVSVRPYAENRTALTQSIIKKRITGSYNTIQDELG
jgi:hypothetical protein